MLFIKGYKLKSAAIISLHARLGCIDDANASPLGHWLAQAMDLPLVQEIGYPTPGSFGTWAQENRQPLITVEFPDASIITIRRQMTPVLCALMAGLGASDER